jgi:hypothetical protein
MTSKLTPATHSHTITKHGIPPLGAAATVVDKSVQNRNQSNNPKQGNLGEVLDSTIPVLFQFPSGGQERSAKVAQKLKHFA